MTTALPRLWVDGQPCAPQSPVFSAHDRVATLGDAVFDTALCINGQVIARQAHLNRLQQAAQRFSHQYDDSLLSAAYDLCRDCTGPAVLRIAVARGAGGRGLAIAPESSSRIVTCLSALPAGIQFAPVALDIAAAPRNAHSPLSRWKTACYLDAILASTEAQRKGFGDALFLNTDQRVCCTTMANLFALQEDGRLVTPACAEGAVAGIMRSWVLEIAAQIGVQACENTLDLSDLRRSREVFVTNSLRLIVPVTNFGGPEHTLRRALSEAVCARIKTQTGTDLAPPDWA